MDTTSFIVIILCTISACFIIAMISLLCLRFMNGMLDRGDKRPDQSHLVNEGYRRICNAEATTASNKSKQPEATVTIHTVQPYGKLKQEESDIPYSEESEEDVEFLGPQQRIISPKETLGKLHFSLQYLPSSKLLVKLFKADDLPEAKKELPTVYVTAKIGPHQNLTSNDCEFKSEIQKGSSCPTFNENFEFDVTDISVHEKHLRFVIWYMDSFSQGECLGVVEQHLSILQNKAIISHLNTETVLAKDIQPISQKFQDSGETFHRQGALLFSVTYLPTTNRLTVVLFKGHNISLVSEDNQGIYAEVTIVHVKRNKRKRKVTSSVSGTNNPIYNEAILFDLGDLDIENVKVQITLKQKRIDKPDKAISRVLIGSDVLDSTARVHWSNAINASKPVAQWHYLRPCRSFNIATRRRLQKRLSDSDNGGNLQCNESSSSED